jgi:hypothetical protein
VGQAKGGGLRTIEGFKDLGIKGLKNKQLHHEEHEVKKLKA